MLVAQKYTVKNIAYRLRIGEWTVATYFCLISVKLGVDSVRSDGLSLRHIDRWRRQGRSPESQAGTQHLHGERDALI